MQYRNALLLSVGACDRKVVHAIFSISVPHSNSPDVAREERCSVLALPACLSKLACPSRARLRFTITSEKKERWAREKENKGTDAKTRMFMVYLDK